jgi:hypothetical protein
MDPRFTELLIAGFGRKIGIAAGITYSIPEDANCVRVAAGKMSFGVAKNEKLEGELKTARKNARFLMVPPEKTKIRFPSFQGNEGSGYYYGDPHWS